MLREKEHVLSAPEENILAQMSEVTGATSDVFKMLNNADLTFGTVTDEDGDEVHPYPRQLYNIYGKPGPQCAQSCLTTCTKHIRSSSTP